MDRARKQVSYLLAGLALIGLSTLSMAQGVYVIKGKNGPEFSNVPQPGAKEITLKPLNVIAPPDRAAPVLVLPRRVLAEPADERQAALSAYRRLVVLFPENGGAIATGTAVFEVRLAVEPALQLAQQHAFVISINGRQVGRRFTSTEFTVLPEFWNDGLLPDNDTLELEVGIVDGDGRSLMRVAPVRFVLRRLALRNRFPLPVARPQRPPTVQAPVTPPREPTYGQTTLPAGR